MSTEDASGNEPGSKDPHSLLGINLGASFEEIQLARDKRLKEIGNDLKAKSEIEASYDALLMHSLKERQLGKLSKEAANASQQEDGKKEESGLTKQASALMTRMRSINSSKNQSSNNTLWPRINFVRGEGLITRILLGLGALVLLIITPSSTVELILSLSTICLFISQVKRGRKVLAALGWSVVTLSIGLIVGGVINQLTGDTSSLKAVLTSDQVEAIPAMILIWVGVITFE